MTTESAQCFRLAQMGKLIYPGSYVLHFMQCQFVNDMVFLWVTLLMCSSVPQSESFHLQDHYGRYTQTYTDAHRGLRGRFKGEGV